MLSPISDERAHSLCLELLNKLETEKDISKITLEHELSHEQLYPEFQNFEAGDRIFRSGMFAVLVCTDADGREIVLKAFSGQYSGSWIVPGWVPPLFDAAVYGRTAAGKDKQLHELAKRLMDHGDINSHIQYRSGRRNILVKCRQELFSLYRIHCIDGSVKAFTELFADKLPPDGTGDCCAPKLFDYAFSHGFHPESYAECYWGKTTGNNFKESGHFYTPCSEKCRPVLDAMFGFEIVYRDGDIIVVNKLAGFDKDAIASRIRILFPSCTELAASSFPDSDISGLAVFSCSEKAAENLCAQFKDGSVQQKYMGVLDGVPENPSAGIEKGSRCGQIKVPQPAVSEHDRQTDEVYDKDSGKNCVIRWKRLHLTHAAGRPETWVTSVLLEPSGGTVQEMRAIVCSASGFNLPLLENVPGCYGSIGRTVMLHASDISFTHPVTGEHLQFHSEPDFHY